MVPDVPAQEGDTRDLPYTYMSETTQIPSVTGDFCPACAESILDGTESDRVMRKSVANPNSSRVPVQHF